MTVATLTPFVYHEVPACDGFKQPPSDDDAMHDNEPQEISPPISQRCKPTTDAPQQPATVPHILAQPRRSFLVHHYHKEMNASTRRVRRSSKSSIIVRKEEQQCSRRRLYTEDSQQDFTGVEDSFHDSLSSLGNFEIAFADALFDYDASKEHQA
ncbi:expressed unknown protein [Seminavis robusta]|uniref:Uncharacterized protein n=1 Tax=Seminavis robusta TaxID=568900 RepID=A0A9N8HNC0_9STRA|nr:expressed unknown protein [Seminavis robusta]|eukprot:Sro1070_g237820.1 n/a (154) ;mRNA; f:32031-32492